MLRLITDFDGPIIDVSERYYRVYQFCLEKIKQADQPVRQLSKAEFWQLKRAKVPERRIGVLSGLDEPQTKEFAHLRRQTVHTLPYMAYDQLVPGARETLERIEQLKIDLAVLTMRRVKELEVAFEKYDLGQFFPPARCYCLSNDHVKTTDVQDKPLLMERALKELPPLDNIWMVGDTEADIIAAQTHNVKVIGVLSGIRDRTQLERYQPDFIVNNLGEAVDLLTAALSARR